jgi:dephospho-CoA kinase
MQIIGITGTLGAGKGTIVDYLVKNKGFKHYSVRQFLIEEIEKRGLPVNRDSMTQVANELRAANTPYYIVAELYKQALKSGKDAVIESIRTPGEVEFLQQQGNFILIAVDADPKTRFDRIKIRKSATDQIDFDTFLANEKREMTTEDPNKQNLQKCIQMADITLHNDGSIDELVLQLENKLIGNSQ